MQSAYNTSESDVIEIDDPLIHAYDFCERYNQEVDDNDTIEEEKFAEGSLNLMW